MSDHSYKKASAAEPAQTIPWEQLAKLSPDNQKELFEKLIAQNQFYFQLTENLQKSHKHSEVSSENSWDLSNTLFGGSPLTNLQNPTLPSSELSRLLGLPDIEALKDQAELFSEWTKKLGKLLANQQKLASFLAELNESALKQFNAKKIDSENNKALYALWTECGEQAFAELNQNEHYIEAQATFLNTLTEIESLKKKVMQSAFQQSGLSSQHDLETIYQSLHQLKREFRKESRQQAEEISRLKKELSKFQQNRSVQQSSHK